MGLFDKIATKLGSKNDEETAENVRSDAAAEAEAPAAPQADNAQGIEAFIPGPVETPSSSAVKNIRKTLLAITNDEQCRSILERTLQSRYSLIYANNGVEAMKMVKEHAGEYALIILDVMMNNMEGEDILRFIKDDSALGQVPVAAIVSAADKALHAKMLSMGAVVVIPKPLPGAAMLYSAIDKCAELAECRDIIRLTERDSLTTLYNLDYFNYYVSLFDRYNRGIRMDAIMAVISNYHLIREHYGRRFADSVLKDVGMAVRDATAATGGYSCRKDEGSFLIYCPHTDDHTKLLDTISAAVDTDSAVAGKVRLCFGVYADVDKDVTIDQRFEFADIAAQSVISSYTERIGLYDSEMKRAALYKEQILGEFLPSLSEKRFRIYFQPKFDIRGDRPVLYSAEALVRWDHPQLGMLSPGQFIGLLEDNGLITQLDRYVWSEAASHIRRWKDEYGYSVPVSVNISQIDMLLPLLKDIFKEIIRTYSLTEDDIILEITQSADSSNNDQILSAAQELRGMGLGLRIEMGNFGAGYSSIGMLSHMPVDALKIDMEFVHNSLGDNKDMRMIELIIDIADYLHVPVVAEGVETEEQYLLLKALGCDLCQGFYFSKPVPVEEFDRFIREGRDVKTHIVPDTQRSYVSISKAITGEYERIIYIDVNTDHYMQFYSGTDGEFRIHTGGKDFFADADEVLLNLVVAEDRERIGKLMSKEELMGWIEADKPISTRFKRTDEGNTLCTLETIHTRNQDDHHVVIGIRRNKKTAE